MNILESGCEMPYLAPGMDFLWPLGCKYGCSAPGEGFIHDDFFQVAGKLLVLIRGYLPSGRQNDKRVRLIAFMVGWMSVPESVSPESAAFVES